MIRHKFNFFSVKINFCLFLLLLSLFTSTSYAISFAYDELGRLKAATDNAGNTAAYLYDALGNILQIQQIPNGTLAITEFTPDGGLIGSSVTLYGGGFSATPANNIVKFNGIAATVTSATATKLVVTVPTGATTGKIAVTVGGSTATSQENFTVVSSLGVPTISSFSPTCAVPGTLVTVTGTNFDPTPNATKLEIGASLAAIASISATQLQFTMPTLQGSGKVSVVTAKGKATNSAVLLVPPQQPTAIACTNIVSQQTLVVGGAAGALNINPAGKYGIIQFDGVLSDYLTLQVSGYAHSAGGSTAYTLYGPDNVSVASGNLSASNLSIHLPRLSKSG
ncbi:MAG: IPT/TIG domain-containing protein, partial [Betaproteobacteria bacterium]|nr:IPT/TIG domain-containing protein [Betaproteobacteria bacterium]